MCRKIAIADINGSVILKVSISVVNIDLLPKILKGRGKAAGLSLSCLISLLMVRILSAERIHVSDL